MKTKIFEGQELEQIRDCKVVSTPHPDYMMSGFPELVVLSYEEEEDYNGMLAAYMSLNTLTIHSMYAADRENREEIFFELLDGIIAYAEDNDFGTIAALYDGSDEQLGGILASYGLVNRGKIYSGYYCKVKDLKMNQLYRVESDLAKYKGRSCPLLTVMEDFPEASFSDEFADLVREAKIYKDSFLSRGSLSCVWMQGDKPKAAVLAGKIPGGSLVAKLFVQKREDSAYLLPLLHEIIDGSEGSMCFIAGTETEENAYRLMFRTIRAMEMEINLAEMSIEDEELPQLPHFAEVLVRQNLVADLLSENGFESTITFTEDTLPVIHYTNNRGISYSLSYEPMLERKASAYSEEYAVTGFWMTISSDTKRAAATGEFMVTPGFDEEETNTILKTLL